MFLHCYRLQHKRNQNTYRQTQTHTQTQALTQSELDKGNQGRRTKSVAYAVQTVARQSACCAVTQSHSQAHTQSMSINQIGIQLVFVLLNLCCIVFYFKYDEASCGLEKMKA